MPIIRILQIPVTLKYLDEMVQEALGDSLEAEAMRTVTFSISPSPPFRLDLTALALQRKPVNIIDTWNGETYSRVLVIEDIPLLVQVTQSGAGCSPRLHVKAQGHRIPRDARTH